MNVFVFDIETIPDIDGCRRLYDLHGLSDDDVARAVFQMRRQQVGNDFLRHHLHRIVAISSSGALARGWKPASTSIRSVWRSW